MTTNGEDGTATLASMLDYWAEKIWEAASTKGGVRVTLDAVVEHLYVGLDQRFHYICEHGHNIVTTDANHAVCTAITPWPGGTECGGEVEYRVVPMLHDGGDGKEEAT